MVTMCLAILPLTLSVWVLFHADTFASANRSPTLPGHGNNHILDSKYAQPYMPRYDLGIRVTQNDLNNAVTFATGIVNSMKRLELSLGWSDIRVKAGTPSHGMFVSFAPEREAVNRGRDALVATKASVQLLNRFCNKHNLDHRDCVKYLTKFKLDNTPLQASCARLKSYCSYEEYMYPYRSINGSCNHVSDGSKGESFSGYTRLLYPDYLDGIHEPRRAVNKKVLPSPRTVSTSIVDHDRNFDDHLTLAVMQWGQFIEHDMSRTASAIMVHTENAIECCTAEGTNLSPRYVHPFCSPVHVSTDDRYFSGKGLDCMNYVRSIPALRSDCSFGPSNQLNQATHYLDGSQIYGSTYRKSNSLRSFVDGKLDVSSFNGKHFLPISQHPAEDCQVNFIQGSCFKSGDPRVNFQPQLTAMHTMWFREHNRIAKELAKLNTLWDDETLFQETRRIVIAEMQHITYGEWLKKILAGKYKSLTDDSIAYEERVDPSVSNSFASAVIRSLKSLYDGNIKLYDEDRETNRTLGLHKYFNNPIIIQKRGILDNLVRGLATQRSQKVDRHYAEDLINNLYTNGHFGFDVLSIDIQRGRDHGLPGYSQYRTLCGLQNANNFDDFSDSISEKHIALLSKIYTHPKDVDLIVGGLLEDHENGSVFGPTFSCIIADQFARTKKGDRYFHSNEDQPRPFTKSQLAAIRKVTLARIFCDNGDDIGTMQPDVFEQISKSNKRVSCKGEEIPRLDLFLWEESRERYFNKHH